MFSYNVLITFTIHSSTPNWCKAHHSTSLGTLSNAFSKSTNAIHNSFFFSRNLSCTCLSTNIASVVPLPGLKPNCIIIELHITPQSYLQDPLKNLHNLIKQLDSSVRTTV